MACISVHCIICVGYNAKSASRKLEDTLGRRFKEPLLLLIVSQKCEILKVLIKGCLRSWERKHIPKVFACLHFTLSFFSVLKSLCDNYRSILRLIINYRHFLCGIKKA